MQNYKNTVTFNASMFASLGEGISNETGAYSTVPLVFRATRLTCDALASVPVTIHKGDKPSAWPFKEDVYNIVWRVVASLKLAGAAYVLKLKTKGWSVYGLQVLNPLTVTVSDTGGVLTFTQNASGQTATFEADRVIYIREYNPSDDIQPGPSSAKVSIGDAKLLRFINLFSNKFFEGGAMPVTLIGLPADTPEPERKRTENFFRNMMEGVKNAFRVLAINSDEVKPTVLTQPIKDLAIPELQQQARQAIALAFGIPQTMLEDAANYATAAEHRLSFWQDTIRPLGMKISGAFNEQLFRALGLEMTFAFDELDIFQTDEAQRAGSLNQLIAAGVPLLMAMDILGYDIDDEQRMALEKATQPTASTLSIELDRWKRKALRALQSGKSADVEFISEIIPATLHSNISAALKTSTTPGQVRDAFTAGDPSDVIDALREAVRCIKES